MQPNYRLMVRKALIFSYALTGPDESVIRSDPDRDEESNTQLFKWEMSAGWPQLRDVTTACLEAGQAQLQKCWWKNATSVAADVASASFRPNTFPNSFEPGWCVWAAVEQTASAAKKCWNRKNFGQTQSLADHQTLGLSTWLALAAYIIKNTIECDVMIHFQSYRILVIYWK